MGFKVMLRVSVVGWRSKNLKNQFENPSESKLEKLFPSRHIQ